MSLTLEPIGPRIISTACVERQAVDLAAVDLDDVVVGEDAGLGGRGVVDGRDDLDDPLLHRHLDAEAAELAGIVFLHLA